ncbi:hypothetical protein [Geodermatophilus maliterrae]|uniref:Uncharacterized protein n=1 Tax=Geodermatophilus maliterrae TaxID=3162531 RepID=A0ABV3XG07_9ACTN
MIALAVAGGAVLVAVVVALALTVGGGGGGAPGSTTTGGDTIPEATVSPVGLGNDPGRDDLAEGCFRGDMGACDDLYLAAGLGSVYEAYGDTCAGRQPAGTGVLCTEAFPG